MIQIIRVKPGSTVTFMKYFACVVSLIFLLKTWIRKKIAALASNSLKLAELAVNELKKASENIYQYSFLCLINDCSMYL